MASGRNSGKGSTLLLGLSSELRVLPGIGIRLFAPRKRRRIKWYARDRGNHEKSLRKMRSCSNLGRQEFRTKILKDLAEGDNCCTKLLTPQRWERRRAWAGFRRCVGSERPRLSAFLQYAHSRGRCD